MILTILMSATSKSVSAPKAALLMIATLRIQPQKLVRGWVLRSTKSLSSIVKSPASATPRKREWSKKTFPTRFPSTSKWKLKNRNAQSRSWGNRCKTQIKSKPIRWKKSSSIGWGNWTRLPGIIYPFLSKKRCRISSNAWSNPQRVTRPEELKSMKSLTLSWPSSSTLSRLLSNWDKRSPSVLDFLTTRPRVSKRKH